MVQQAAFRELTASLLERHYDPSYRKSMMKNFGKLLTAQTISLTNLHADSLRAAALRLLNRTEANVNGNSDLTVSSAGNIAGVAEKIKIAPNLCEMRYLAE
jgi:hypothetical protein